MAKPLYGTNILIDIPAGLELAQEKFARHAEHASSVITSMEAMIGARPQDATATRRCLESFAVAGTSDTRSGRLLPDLVSLARAAPERSRFPHREAINRKAYDAVYEQAVPVCRPRRIKLPDAIILASAQVRGPTLLTRNTTTFRSATRTCVCLCILRA